MADLATLNGVYNHYLTTYAPKSSTALDTHKKRECPLSHLGLAGHPPVY